MTILSRKNFWIIAANSLSSFVLSYLFIFYLNHLSLALTAGMFSYPITLDYASYFFHIEPYQWTHDAVFLIFSSGFLLVFIVGVLSLLAFFHTLGDAIPFKVFFFWLIMHSSNVVFGGLMLGNLLTDGIGHVFNWMYLADTAKMIISLLGLTGLLWTALYASRLVAISSDAYFEKYNDKISPFFITAQVIVPYLIGSPLLFMYFYPKNMFQERYGWIVLGFMLIIFFIRAKHTDDLIFEQDDHRSIRPMKQLIFFTIISIILSRLIFAKGLYLAW